MVTSITTEKAFGNVQQPMHVRNSQKTRKNTPSTQYRTSTKYIH